ncbi:hypothetical protein BGW41_007015 [Actinomortierella wolfii]|nr:hypothetical protein BGW41_007015 [Actinomortierella wolfii]
MHNHPVGLERPLDTCALSKAARDRIKAALEQGQTIKDVLLRSKEEADKRVEEMRRNNEPIVLCRDDVIAYNDVYNLWYTMTTRRGDQDEAAQLDRLTIQHHQSDGMNQLDAVGPTVNSDTDNTEANIPEPDTVESEAAEAIRHLEELIAAIRSDPRNYCLYRDDITSIIDKQKRQQGKRPWQQSLHVSAKRFRNNQESEERQANADDGK